MVSVDTANALRSMGELSGASDALADSSGATMGKMATGTGNAFAKLGTQPGKWGVEAGEDGELMGRLAPL